MNQRLAAPLLTRTPDFDPVTDCPDDVERLVTAATNAGYRLTPRDAAELWRMHAGDVCASWFSVAGELLKHAEVLRDAADKPTPPEGFAS